VFAPPPVFEVPLRFNNLYISEDAKRFREILDSSTLDRNLIIWYILNRDVAMFIEDAKKKINYIDNMLIGQFKRMLLVMKSMYHSSFSIIYELFDFLKKYVGVSEEELGVSIKGMMGRDGVRMITEFYGKMVAIGNHLEKVGFEYVPPVFGGVYNAPKVSTESQTLIQKRGLQLPPLILEDGADNDLFESDNEDACSEESDEESSSESDSDGSNEPSEFGDERESDSDSDSDSDGSDTDVNKKLIKKLATGFKN
jgi:hypothetical protein